MNKIAYPIISLFVLLLVVNCPAPFNTIDMPGSGSIQLLPRDEVSYTSRSFSEDFTYKTLFPVRLDIIVELYDQSADSSGEPEPLSSDTANVKLKLVNSRGTVVFESFLGDDGHLKTSVYLPAVSEDITLTLQADGFKTREVVIEDMVEYKSIVRTMSMGRKDSLVSAKGMELDSDGDGIPDSYDVEAFQVNIPADGKLTVAYEDLYGRADAGDADYNDFITAYSITETISPDGTKLEKIYVEASGREKLAGYDHIFGFRLNSFTGLADISGEYVDRLGNTRSFELLDQKSPVNIELFKSTSVAKNKTVNFTVTFQEKQNIDEGSDEIIVDRPPYNPYLYVKNTGHDVHLIGEESLDGTYSSFMDENHFPWALLLPIDWDPPSEGQRIEEKYPRFTRWRESGGELSRDWYLHNDPWEPEEPARTLELAADINPGSAGSSPMYLTEYGGELYFSADDGSSGRELWKYDTASGTAGLVDDINAGSISSNPQGFTVFSSELYFQADDGDSGRELWKYGGSGDAQLVADLNSGSNGSIPKDFAVFGNELYFYALASVPPVLYRCDESDQCSAATGVTTSYPSDLVSYGTELYYQGRDGDRELWAYDGSSERKINIGDDTVSATSGSPTGMTVFDGRLYFSAAGDGSDYELWVYDDAWTDAQEKPINSSASSDPTGFTVYGGAVYFSADGGDGVELWRCSSGGDPEAVAAVNDEVEIGLPVEMTVFDGKLYFVADDGVHGMELWSYDGISSPVLVEDIYEGAESSNPAYLTVYDNALYFAADNGLGLQLWKMTL